MPGGQEVAREIGAERLIRKNEAKLPGPIQEETEEGSRVGTG